jgi:hypothetical protein
MRACVQGALTGMEALRQEMLDTASEVAQKLVCWRQRSAAARELMRISARVQHNRQAALLIAEGTCPVQGGEISAAGPITI